VAPIRRQRCRGLHAVASSKSRSKAAAKPLTEAIFFSNGLFLVNHSKLGRVPHGSSKAVPLRIAMLMQDSLMAAYLSCHPTNSVKALQEVTNAVTRHKCMKRAMT